MFAKYASIALLGTALIGSAAYAQSGAPATSGVSGTTATSQNLKGNWRASKLVGLNVYNDSNEKLGNIDDVLVDNSGKINAVVLGVGGFLGVGERNIAVSFDTLKWVNEPVRANTASSGTTTSPTSSGGSMGAPTGSSTTGSSSSATQTTTRDPWYPDHATMSGTLDQLKAMPEFKYSDYK